ncbi:unnamed protein product [Schistosoma curassoni]|uniref:Secreted protein n=1 Tax=Schistosoma curassoni TaxID=6186 RepID=A0A183JSR6_9TREM|nr:unnamed protein product [Schistosoma curassoni]
MVLRRASRCVLESFNSLLLCSANSLDFSRSKSITFDSSSRI